MSDDEEQDAAVAVVDEPVAAHQQAAEDPAPLLEPQPMEQQQQPGPVHLQGAPAGPQLPDAPEPVQPQGLGAEHQAMLQGGGPAGFQPYRKPDLFHVRVSTVHL